MKTVRLENNIVVEIIPDYALPVEYWYGPFFAAQCREAPDDVEQHWVYNPETDTFSPPPPEPEPEPDPVTNLEELAIEHDFRILLLELGIQE